METGSNLEPTVQQLLDTLQAQHRELELRKAELENHISLTSDEQLELSRIKKLKLRTKDQIYTLTHRS